MTEPKRRKVKAEKERVGRVWGEGAWGDILPSVCHLLPPREIFLVQRISRLFQRASERARLAVGQLELCPINGGGYDMKNFKFTAKILDPNASDGITSLQLPNLSGGEGKAHESRLEECRRECEEALGKLSLPTLSHVSLCTGPLTQSLLPFLRSHPSISSLELTMVRSFFENNDLKEVEIISEGLSEAEIRQLTVRVKGLPLDSDSFNDLKKWKTNIFYNVEELSLYGVLLHNLQFLPDPAKLRSLHSDNVRDFHWVENRFLLAEATGLRCLTITSYCPPFHEHIGTEFAKTLRGVALEFLHLGFVCFEDGGNGKVKAIVESLASGGAASNLAQRLQELTVSVRPFCGRPDKGVFDTDAFLRFPRLHSLRLRMEIYGLGQSTLTQNALSALPVVNELTRKLRVLEISVHELDR